MPSMFKIFMRSEGVKIVFFVQRLEKAFICDFSLEKRKEVKILWIFACNNLSRKETS